MKTLARCWHGLALGIAATLAAANVQAQSAGQAVVNFSDPFALGNFFNQARGQFGMWTMLDANGRKTHCTLPYGGGCWAYRQRVGQSTYYVNVDPYSDRGNDDHMHLNFSDPTITVLCTCHPSADAWMDNLPEVSPPAYSVGYGRCGQSGESSVNCPNPSWASLARGGAYPHTIEDGLLVALDNNTPFDIGDITITGDRKVLALWYDGVNLNSTGPISPGYSLLDISQAYWVKFVDYNVYGLNIHDPDAPFTIVDMLVMAPGGQLDLAFQKTATQSSTLYGASASRAIDLDEDGNWNDGSVTHSNLEAAYWTVDLKKAYRIGKVKVWNRTDCCGDRLSNFDVKFSSDGAHWNSIYVSSLGGAPSTTVDFKGGGARYVRVQLRSASYLELAEVEVYAAPPPPLR